ncbi:glycosyltransferase family 2 protein [Hymenobacter tenuis]
MASEESSSLRSPWHCAPPPLRALQATIIIPAKDEAHSITAVLAALAAQTDLQGCPLPMQKFEVLVLANNCQDGTAQVARAAAAQYPTLTVHVAEITLPPAEAHVGRARRLLMDEACRRLEMAGNASPFIASTDADTLVSNTWLAAIEAELAAGADAVGGRILTPSSGSWNPSRRYQLQDATYHLLCARLEQLVDPISHDPWPRHHQHFGASLAITAAAYRQVGGLPVVPYLEDEALCQALLRHDLRLRHSPAVRVFTSDRHEGRVAVGLSWQLRQWATLQQAQQEPTVENPTCLMAEWQLRRAVRQLWQQPASNQYRTWATVQAATHLNATQLSGVLKSHATFGQLWESIRARIREQNTELWPAVPVSVGIRMLRQALAAHLPAREHQQVNEPCGVAC